MTDYNPWIGRTSEATDIVTTSLVERFRATLEGDLWEDCAVPPGLHWCLFPPVAPRSEIGEDGHPARTSEKKNFFPPIPLPSRMWAGGSLQFISPIEIGMAMTRKSIIVEIIEKQGRSGQLFIVKVSHECSANGNLLIREQQNIVYKELRTPNEGSQYAPVEFSTNETTGIDPVTLFRYSALTFNGHRIHYDADYARDKEHYPACVVHGPLQATILLNHVARQLGSVPQTFEYRGVSPLFVNENYEIKGDNGSIWIEGPMGRQTMSARFA